MKKIFTLLIGFMPAFTFAAHTVIDPVIEKTKTYFKSYNVTRNDKITLENSFGEMKLNTWEKQEVKVEVTIVAKAASSEKAQEILDKIRIEDGKTAEGVYFKTKADNINTGNKKDKNYKEEGMEINYNVFLPSENPLNASNSFGALIIGDHKGPVTLQSKFGSLSAGNLNNVKQLHVEFGKANINSVNNGKVTVKFSKATMGKFSGDVSSVFEFCDAVNIRLDNSIAQLDVKSSYSKLEINLSSNISANFDIKTSFGDIDNNTSYVITEKNNDKKNSIRFDKHYSAITGSGASKINIQSEFGKIKFL